MLPTLVKREQRLRISEAETGGLVRELVVDLRHAKDVFERASQRERGRIESAEERDLRSVL